MAMICEYFSPDSVKNIFSLHKNRIAKFACNRFRHSRLRTIEQGDDVMVEDHVGEAVHCGFGIRHCGPNILYKDFSSLKNILPAEL